MSQRCIDEFGVVHYSVQHAPAFAFCDHEHMSMLHLKVERNPAAIVTCLWCVVRIHLKESP